MIKNKSYYKQFYNFAFLINVKYCLILIFQC